MRPTRQLDARSLLYFLLAGNCSDRTHDIHALFFLQGLALMELTTSVAFVTLVIRADTAM